MHDAETEQRELTECEKRDNVIRLAFEGDPAKLDAFVQLIQEAIPENTGVVLRGSDRVSLEGQGAVRRGRARHE